MHPLKPALIATFSLFIISMNAAPLFTPLLANLFRSPENVATAAPQETFTNPILPAPSQDPWIVMHEGVYYYCESHLEGGIYIRASRTIQDLSKAESILVWHAPATGINSKEVWAPELHFINGRWYIYYAADDGKNENHRMFVLESEGSDPFGKYLDRGMIDTGTWSIDGTVFQHSDGKLYFIWSGWPGGVDGQQNLYIAPMKSPTELAGPRHLLTTPTQKWECSAMPICEGPEVLQKDGRVFVIYSASASWTVDYCLGLLSFDGGDILDSKNWTKQGQVLKRTDKVWGVGHCSFVKSPDQSEDWILFHAKSKRKSGWMDRNVRAQRFTWTASGLPFFGEPVNIGVSLKVPSTKKAEEFASTDLSQARR